MKKIINLYLLIADFLKIKIGFYNVKYFKLSIIPFLLFVFLIGSNIVYGQKQNTITTTELGSIITERDNLKEQWRKLNDEGKSFKADEISEKIKQLNKKILQPGMIYEISSDCPATRSREGGNNYIEFSCIENEYSYEFKPTRDIGLYKDPKWRQLWEYDAQIVLKFHTDNKIAAQIEDIEGKFIGKFQVGGYSGRFQKYLLKILEIKIHKNSEPND